MSALLMLPLLGFGLLSDGGHDELGDMLILLKLNLDFLNEVVRDVVAAQLKAHQ